MRSLLDKPCVAPFTSVNVDSTGQVVPCCVYNMKGDHDAWDKNLDTNVGNNIRNKFKSWDWLRKDINEGKYPSNCNVCKLRGQAGKTRADDYRRNLEPYITDEMTKPKILMMDLDLSNKCNLKCLHCGVHSSTGWLKEEEKLVKIENNKFNRESRPGMIRVKHNTISDLLEFPSLTQNVRMIEVKGGEPLYQDERYDLLDVFINHGVSKNITLKYITNMTYRDKKLLTMWSNFHRIRLIISIEGTGELYNLIRGHKTATTKTISDNVNWYIDTFREMKKNKHDCWLKEKIEPLKDNRTIIEPQLRINWSVTAMACNLLDIDNIFNFIEKTDKNYKNSGVGSIPTLVVNPTYLDYRVLPRWYINEAREIFRRSHHNAVKNFNKMLTVWEEEERIPKFIKFIEYIETMCEIRKQNPSCIKYWKELKDEYEVLKNA